MPAVAQKERYTYADYAELPEGAPYQLIGAELIMSPSPRPYHQAISMRLSAKLHHFVQQKQQGTVLTAPIDVYLSDEETYQPDLIFISREREDRIGETKIKGAPDLVMEILSPSTAYYDLKQKKRVYEATGVREYWIVDPIEVSIEVFENRADGFEQVARAEAEGTVASTILDGFSVSLADVF